MSSRNLGSGSFKSTIENQRNKISYCALTDLFLTVIATVTFVVLMTSRPFNTLVFYMLMNLVHFILIPFTFSLCKRNIHSQTISYYIVFLAMFLTLDCVSFVIRIAAFSFCDHCTSSPYLASTLIPFFIVLLYVLLDIWMAYCAYSLRSLAFTGEKGREPTSMYQGIDDEEASPVYAPRQMPSSSGSRESLRELPYEIPRNLPPMSPPAPYYYPQQEEQSLSPVPVQRYMQPYSHVNFAAPEPSPFMFGSGELGVYHR